MSLEENEKKIESVSLDYEACPAEFKQLIEQTDLDKLVYWKLKEKLGKESQNLQNEVLKGVIADVERPLFAIVLNKTNGNQSKAAEVLGCNRNTLHRKLKEFFIDPRHMKKATKGSKKAYYSSSLPFHNSASSKMIEM